MLKKIFFGLLFVVSSNFFCAFCLADVNFEPISLEYSDTDNNNKIDKLKLEFYSTLSGSLNLEKMFFYSKEGGLSSQKLNSVLGTEMVLAYSLENNFLILNLIEQDLEKINLEINNSTSSDLRIKNNSGVGIFLDTGEEIDISYTSSFDTYKNVTNSNNIKGENSEIEVETGTGETEEILSNTGSVENVENEINLEPISLEYLDSDNDHKIDKLSLEFENTLTGSLNLEKIFFYSKEQGLSSQKLNSVSGENFIKKNLIEKNKLILEIFEQDLEKISLEIDNSTQSDLRIKVNNGVGIFFNSGEEIEISYTTSFDNYKNVINKNKLQTEIPIGELDNLNLEPINLKYLDSDNNNKIDQLKLEFENSLTGSLNLDKIFIYSKEGGLSSEKIDSISGTGFILDYELEKKNLILNIKEQDLEKINLAVDNSTQSDLRIKVNNGVGIYFESGEEIEISYTTSFDEYRNVAFEITEIENNINQDTNFETSSGTLDTSSGSIDETGSGVIIELENTGTGDILENNEEQEEFLNNLDIIFQRPTYFDENNFQNELNCDRNYTDCKANFNVYFEDKAINSSVYSCEWDFGFGEETKEENKCNPNTITYPEGEFETKLTINKVDDDSFVVKKKFNIINKGYLETSNSNSNSSSYFYSNYIPIKAEITLQTKESENLVLEDSDKLICYTKDKCSINFDGSDSEGYNLNYFWNFGNTQTSYKKNPGAEYFEKGEYRVSFKVKDSTGSVSYDYFEIIIKDINEKTVSKESSKKITDTENKNFEQQEINKDDIEITKIMPNPYGKDDYEWIMLKNVTDKKLNLNNCFLESTNSKYNFEDNFSLGKNKRLKLFKDKSKISLKNSGGDFVKLECNNIEIDKISYDFGVNDNELITKNYTKHKEKVTDYDILSFLYDELEELNIEEDVGEIAEEIIEEKTENIKNIVNKNFEMNLDKLNSGIKISGKYFPVQKIYFSIDKKNNVSFFNFFPQVFASNFYEIETDNDGNFDLIIPELALGEYEIQPITVLPDGENLILEQKENLSLEQDDIVEIQSIVEYTGSESDKQIGSDFIICNDVDECSLNFDGSKSIGTNLIYTWDFGNGEKSNSKNPGYIKYKKGNYILTLKIDDGIKQDISMFKIFVLGKEKQEEITSVKETDSQKNLAISTKESKNTIVLGEDLEVNLDINEEILIYTLLFLLFLSFTYIILRERNII